MFHFIFKKIYLNIKKDIEEQNAARIASHRLPGDVKISTLPYLDSGNEMHRFNIYKNGRTGGAAPLIVDIHGGGWIAGDKDTNGLFCCRLAEGGFDVSSLSYRNVDSCSIKEQIQDIFAYLHYIKNNATALGLSFENVFLSGDSAGGQLALLAYNVNRSAKLREMFGVSPVDIKFKAMALIHSVCYVNMAGKLKNNPVISRLISVPGWRERFTANKITGANFTMRPAPPPHLSRKTRPCRLYFSYRARGTRCTATRQTCCTEI